MRGSAAVSLLGLDLSKKLYTNGVAAQALGELLHGPGAGAIKTHDNDRGTVGLLPDAHRHHAGHTHQPALVLLLHVLNRRRHRPL